MAGGRCLLQTGLSDEELIKEFVDLHPDFTAFFVSYSPADGMTLSMLIRYLVHCYDKNSSIAVEHKASWVIKKKESALRAGFPMVSINGAMKFTESAENIIFNKDPEFSDIIVRYLSLQFSNDFQMYMIYRELYHNVMLELQAFRFPKPSDLAKAKQNGEEILMDIEKLEYKMFSGDEDRTLKSLLYESAYKASLDLRPEQLISRRERNEPLVDITPYGSDYEIPKLKFIGDQ